jgi:hypothetical protein
MKLILRRTYRFVEGRSKSSANRTHAFKQESNSEKIDFVLIDIDIDRGLVDESIVYPKSPRKSGTDNCRAAFSLSVNTASMVSFGRTIDSELATTLCDACVIDRCSSICDE